MGIDGRVVYRSTIDLQGNLAFNVRFSFAKLISRHRIGPMKMHDIKIVASRQSKSSIRGTIKAAKSGLFCALKGCSESFELNCPDLAGAPYLVFRKSRLLVFVDDKHRRRHASETTQLLASGWTVIRLWASELGRDVRPATELILRSVAGVAEPSAASLLAARTVAEFFAGIGLAQMGLTGNDWTVQFANDNARDKILFYKENSPEALSHFDERDVGEIEPDDVPTVSLATACFPCTDLSLAGAQRGLEPGTASSAYLKFTALLNGMGRRRPPFVLLENVVGMLNSRRGLDFQICLEQLRDAGYTVDPFILDAKWFVPHSRPRLFVVAVRNDLGPFEHVGSDRLVDAAKLRSGRLSLFISAHPDLPWSLRPLPLPKKSRKCLKDILEEIRNDDVRWWAPERAARLHEQMSPRHKEVLAKMMMSKRVTYGTVFRRMRNGQSMAELRTDGLAGCLRTPKGGSARQILVRASNGVFAPRLLTPRECARLMGADNISIPESMSVNTALFAFGDGVCVPVVRWIAKHYLTPLASELIHNRVLRINQDRRR